MGTPDFAATALKAILEQTEAEIVAVYCQPPRPKNRGHRLQPSSVHALAEEKQIPVHTPLSFKDKEEVTKFQSLNADIAVVVAYGLLLPKDILEAPTQGCVNIHASLLPRWRGAAPIQRAIQAGDPETGVSIMQMDEGLDTGPVHCVATCPIETQDTASTLHDKLAEIGAQEIVKLLKDFPTTPPTPQSSEGVTYAKKLHKDERQIDWFQSAEIIERTVRAFTPWPGYGFTYQGDFIKILEGKVISQASPESPGTVISPDLQISCGEKSLFQPLVLQKPGKKPTPVKDFLNGLPIPVGTQL